MDETASRCNFKKEKPEDRVNKSGQGASKENKSSGNEMGDLSMIIRAKKQSMISMRTKTMVSPKPVQKQVQVQVQVQIKAPVLATVVLI